MKQWRGDTNGWSSNERTMRHVVAFPVGIIETLYIPCFIQLDLLYTIVLPSPCSVSIEARLM